MSRTRLLATAVLAAALVAACATTTSPTGRTQYVGAVSQAQLDQLGAKAFAEQKASKPQASDAAQRRYVACVTDSIVAGLPAQWRAYRWESAVFVDDEPNAFALPGGKVGVYTGIFRVARDQDQLAAVIAHEVGHVVARHHDERITRQVGAAGAVNLLGALAGDYGQVAAQGGSILAQAGFLLPNSRAQESEADVVGQRLMAEAGYDLLPGSGDLTAAELKLMDALAREQRLKEHLAKLGDRYHTVLIDCPPTLHLLTINALTAAHGVLIPVQCEYFALEGLASLRDTIEAVRRRLNPQLEIEGLLRTMYDVRNNLANEVSAQLNKHFGDKVLRSVIPRNIRLAEAPSHGKPINLYDRESRGAIAYLGLAGEMLRRERGGTAPTLHPN